MRRKMLAVPLAMLGMSAPVQAYDVNDKLSIGGVLAGAGQCQELSNSDKENQCKGALPFQPEVSFRATEVDEFFAKFGLAAGNGLNKNSAFLIPPWAADLEDDVKDINGRNRDYLLTAWYKHTFTLSPENSLGATLGIIDATDYLDDNVYANDEYTQFLNGALVNGPNLFLPSYDAGGAAEWDLGRWSLRGVVMAVGENDDGKSFVFGGAQVGYTLETSLGEGNYRALVNGTSSDFLNPEGTREKALASACVSFDQQLGNVLGAWIRFGWQDDDAAVDFDALYSGGLDISGRAWGRGEDNIGLGYAYLNGGNLDVDKTQVAEAYYRFVLNDYFALTADVQHMKDDFKEGDSPKGWIFGLRAAAEF